MNNSLNAFFCFILCYLLTKVENAVISLNGANPYCSSPGTIVWEFNQTQVDLQIQHDALTYYFDPVKNDSVQLSIKYGDETSNFKFIVFDNNFNYPVIIEAVQSSGGQYSFVGLRNKLLIIQDRDTTDLYGYEFNPTYKAQNKILRYPLTIPSSIAKPYTQAVLFSSSYNNSLDKYSLAVGDSTKFGIFTIQSSNNTLSVTMEGQTINHPLGEISGNGKIIYDAANNSFKNFGNGQWPEFTIFNQQNKIVDCYPFRLGSVMILSLMETTRASGKLFSIIGEDASVQITNENSAVPYHDRYDYLQNFFRAGSAFSHWITLKPNGELLTSIIPANQLDTTGLLFISLSGNKSVLMYENRIDYYEHKASDIVYKYFTKTVSSSDLNINEKGKKRIGLSCMCQEVSRFSCSSKTMVCMISKRVARICGT